MKITNLQTPNGNPAPNQFKITGASLILQDGHYHTGTIFQSYDSNIVFIDYDGNKVYIDQYYWDYSKTTGKYRNSFLDETKKETAAKIASGLYTLTDLNAYRE